MAKDELQVTLEYWKSEIEKIQKHLLGSLVHNQSSNDRVSTGNLTMIAITPARIEAEYNSRISDIKNEFNIQIQEVSGNLSGTEFDAEIKQTKLLFHNHLELQRNSFSSKCLEIYRNAISDTVSYMRSQLDAIPVVISSSIVDASAKVYVSALDAWYSNIIGEYKESTEDPFLRVYWQDAISNIRQYKELLGYSVVKVIQTTLHDFDTQLANKQTEMKNELAEFVDKMTLQNPNGYLLSAVMDCLNHSYFNKRAAYKQYLDNYNNSALAGSTRILEVKVLVELYLVQFHEFCSLLNKQLEENYDQLVLVYCHQVVQSTVPALSARMKEISQQPAIRKSLESYQLEFEQLKISAIQQCYEKCSQWEWFHPSNNNDGNNKYAAKHQHLINSPITTQFDHAQNECLTMIQNKILDTQLENNKKMRTDSLNTANPNTHTHTNTNTTASTTPVKQTRTSPASKVNNGTSNTANSRAGMKLSVAEQRKRALQWNESHSTNNNNDDVEEEEEEDVFPDEHSSNISIGGNSNTASAASAASVTAQRKKAAEWHKQQQLLKKQQQQQETSSSAGTTNTNSTDPTDSVKRAADAARAAQKERAAVIAKSIKK